MTEQEKIESRERRDRLYMILYNTIIKTVEKDRKYTLNDCLEASILLLVNSVKVAETKEPNTHIRVLDYLLSLFDNDEIMLKDEKKHH